MDVSAPINAAIPGVMGLVVAALLPTTEARSGAQVAKACPKASEMGVRKALARLVGSGVVLSVPGGFILNRDHLVYPAIEKLDGLYGRLRERITVAIRDWEGDAACAGLFGSAARRDGDSDSDIDLLLISGHSDLADFSIQLSHQVERWTGNVCHIVALTPNELQRMKSADEPIIYSWIEDFDPIVGSLAKLLSGRGVK